MVVRFRSPIVVEPYRMIWFDVQLTDPGPHEAIFEIKACLVCGSDLHVFKGLHPFAPLPACCGHEVSAQVLETGSKVSTLKPGDRVYVAGAGARPTPCGQCVQCLRGNERYCADPQRPVSFKIGGKVVSRFPSGFGKYTIGNEAYAFKIPDNVSYFEAAVTTDLAYVIGVVRRSRARIGDSAVIIGAGPLGLRTLEVTKQLGLSPIIVSEPLEYRLRLARELGADEVINPEKEDAVEKVLELTRGEGVDIIFDTAGNSRATNQAIYMLKTKIGGAGIICLMGLYESPSITFDSSELMHKAGKIIAEWGMEIGTSNIEYALSLISQGKLHPLKWITHKFPEHKADEAMRMLIEKRDSAIGVEIVH